MSLIRARYRAVNTVMNLRSGYSPSAEVAAYLARLSDEGFDVPSAANLSLLDTFVSAIKSGAWTKLDRLHIWATDSNSINTGRVDLKAPSTSAIATVYNAVTFTNKVGISGDGVSAYVDSGFNPADDGVNFTQNDASFGGYIADRGTTDYILGLSDSDNTRYRSRTTTAQRLNTTSNTTFATAQLEGFSGIQRTSSSVVNNLLTDGTIGANVASTSTSISSGDGNYTYLRSRVNYSNGQIAIGFIGGSFTAGEWLAFRNAVEAYVTAVAAL